MSISGAAPLACPQCHQVDMVQKVTSVVSEGRADVSLSGEVRRSLHIEFSGTSKTVLSERLLPPAKPVYRKQNFGYGTGLSAMIMGMLGIFLVMPIIASFTNVLVAILVLPLWASLPAWIHEIRENKRKQEVENAVPYWEQGMARWNRLFYCFRCDGVFIPNDGSLIPPNQIQGHIFMR